MANLYVNDTLIRSATQNAGVINEHSEKTVYIRITGLGNNFNQSYYRAWGISMDPLASDGTKTAPTGIVWQTDAPSSGGATAVGGFVPTDYLDYTLFEGGDAQYYVWIITASNQYYYINPGGFVLTYWNRAQEVSVSSVSDGTWLSPSNLAGAHEFYILKFSPPAAANYSAHAKDTGSADIILNYVGSGSGRPSFDINSTGKCGTSKDSGGGGGEESYDFSATGGTYHWFVVTGYNGAAMSALKYYFKRLWTSETPSSQPFNGISGATSATLSLSAVKTARLTLKVTNSGPVSITSSGTAAMAVVTSGTGAVDGDSGFYESGIIAQDRSSGSLSLSFNATAGTTYYLWVRTYAYNASGSITISVAPAAGGKASIDNGSSFGDYHVYIDSGSSWDKYIPYIDNGYSWEKY